MGHTFYFLTATWIAAQGVESPILNHADVSQASCGCQSSSAEFAPAEEGWSFRRMFGGGCEGRPGFFKRMQERMSGLFQRSSGDEGTSSCCGGGHGGDVNDVPMPEELHLPMPSAAKASEPPLADIAQRPAAAPKKAAIQDAVAPINFESLPARKPLSRKMAEKVGHENDYSWITGQISLENGHWILRFASPETVDRFGGSLTLAPGANMGNIRSGDLVTVHGHATGSGSDAQYRANTIDLVEHE